MTSQSTIHLILQSQSAYFFYLIFNIVGSENCFISLLGFMSYLYMMFTSYLEIDSNIIKFFISIEKYEMFHEREFIEIKDFTYIYIYK